MTISYSAVPRLVVDGRPLEPQLEPCVASVDVDQRDGLPAKLTVMFRDGHRDVLDRAGIVVGSRLELRAGAVGKAATYLLIHAEVLTLEASYSERTSTVTVRGYDVSHRLHMNRRTRSWTDVTDGDVVRSVAETAGLELGTVDDPGVVHEHLAQVDRTDWDFLSSRARDCGRVLRVSGQQLELVLREQATAGPQPGRLAPRQAGQLVLGLELESLRARVSAAELPARVEVRGWVSEMKGPVVASAPITAPGVELSRDPRQLVDSESVLAVADRTVTTQEQADSLAAVLAAEAGGLFAEAHATCRGDPSLRCGSVVSVGLAGSTFSGRWTVTSACHTFNADGYRTTLALGAEATGAAPARTRPADRGATARGPVVGLVSDVADPAALGRVRVRLPWLSDHYVSDWARVVQPGAGPDRGLLLLPEVDDEVLVAFEQGDERRPLVLGGLHNGQDPPPLAAGDVDDDDGNVRARGLVSRLGHRLVLDDGSDQPGITLATGKENIRIVLDDEERTLTVEVGGDVMVHADGDASVSGRSVRMSGEKELVLSAPSVTVEADSTLTLRGGVVKIN